MRGNIDDSERNNETHSHLLLYTRVMLSSKRGTGVLYESTMHELKKCIKNRALEQTLAGAPSRADMQLTLQRITIRQTSAPLSIVHGWTTASSASLPQAKWPALADVPLLLFHRRLPSRRWQSQQKRSMGYRY